ncbi:DsbA family protein [Paenibacillus sp. HWE-109]|uniref:DsbA family oxidoreductase n=1 Tax=Paenibacillus sp. HWE-109 TaxID=1306526 RepID=UPI001EE0BC6A|nr:DsbA family protein [Paenibacillus sp. HWE-109]UKS28865.1 DsbA family protein [Paenibacillus sp. HWE-109]
MALTLKVYSDYVCPYCILAEGELEAAAAERGIEVDYLPYELRPYPTPTLRPEGEYITKDWRERVYPIAAELGIPIVKPPFSPQPYTHLAFEGYQFAKEHGQAKAYNSRIYQAFFLESKDIGSIDVLTELAGEVGLDPAAYRHALEQRTYKEKHGQALHHANYEANITSAPTFVIGETVIRGMAFKHQFLDAIDRELAKSAR